MSVKPSKCQIAVSECTYKLLGVEEIPSVKDKLEAIRSCPELIHVSDIIDSSFRISLQCQHQSLI